VLTAAGSSDTSHGAVHPEGPHGRAKARSFGHPSGALIGAPLPRGPSGRCTAVHGGPAPARPPFPPVTEPHI